MTEAFVFGPFRLLVARRELLAHGVPVTLGQRAFDVLLLLVSRHGQLVTKDELMAEVWPGVVVEENNIQVHVSALRKVLGTAGDGERYLLTVAGRGYRFVAPVERESADPPGTLTASVLDQPGTAAPATPNNLPQQLTSLIGREGDLAEIKARLNSHRLLTLTGSGGVGKTRLAIEAGGAVLDNYPDGVWLAELAPLSDAQLVTSIIGDVLGVSLSVPTAAIETLTSALKDKQLLLIIDNCEHVIAEAARVTEALIRNCPRVSILASSSRAAGDPGRKRHPRSLIADAARRCGVDGRERTRIRRGTAFCRASARPWIWIFAQRRKCGNGGIDLPKARRDSAGDRIGCAAAEGFFGATACPRAR